MSSRPSRAVSDLRLQWLEEELAVIQLPVDVPWDGLLEIRGFLSLTRVGTELSLVCEHAAWVSQCQAGTQTVGAASIEAGWHAFRVVGPLDFGLVGVLASLTGVLANAHISLFSVSTYETDYLLVRSQMREIAQAALEAAGYVFVGLDDRST